MAIVAFVLLGAAYVGVYSVLTAEARRERDDLLALPDGATLWTAEEPPAAPTGQEAPAIKAWKRTQERWADRQKLEQRSKQVDALFTGLVGAFVLQSAVTLVILVRLSQRSTSTKSRPRERATGR